MSVSRIEALLKEVQLKVGENDTCHIINSLLPKSMKYSAFQFSTTDPVNTVIATIPIGVTCGLFNTEMEHLSKVFMYSTCEFLLSVEHVSTASYAGELDITYLANQFNLEDANIQNSKQFKQKLNNQFAANDDFSKRLLVGRDNTVQINASFSSTSAMRPMDEIYGYLVVKVRSPLLCDCGEERSLDFRVNIMLANKCAFHLKKPITCAKSV